MNFTELVARKIEERREGRSAAVQAAADADGRFRTRAAPLLAAVLDMIETLSRDPMFASALGKPNVAVKREDKNGREGSLRFEGRVGLVSFGVMANDWVRVRIYPGWAVRAALDSNAAYGIDPIKGDLCGIDDLILGVCEHLGDFLADIHLSSAAHLVQPEPGRPAA